MENAIAHLKSDSVLGPHVSRLTIEAPQRHNVYEFLIRSIVYQQLSGKAAGTIYGRFLDLFDGQSPAPELLKDFDHDQLRAVGLSNQKAKYVREVAGMFYTEQWQDERWDDLSDETIMSELTAIKGVGEWTAQMVMIFALRRMDVFPFKDLAMQQSLATLFDLDLTGNKKELMNKMIVLTERWRPYRSVATMYLYRYVDEGEEGIAFLSRLLHHHLCFQFQDMIVQRFEGIAQVGKMLEHFW